MNLQHLIALLKLRFQLTRNQFRRSGKFNAAIMTVFFVLATVTALMMFFVALIAGIVLLPKATSDHVLITWNVIVLVFLAVWLIGLLVELQQLELLSLDKLMHLPVSLKGAFLLNYTSSFFSLSVVMFVPMLFGLSLAMIIVKGFAMLMVPILVAAFLFCVTTVTYQFRGWLGRLMQNKRNRGTIIAIMTMFVILISQIPNLINMRTGKRNDRRRAQEQQIWQQQKQNAAESLEEQLKAGTIDVATQQQRFADMEKRIDADRQARSASRQQDTFETIVECMRSLDAAVPPGWLPYGIDGLQRGRWLTPTLAVFGLAGIGLVSLTISYRSTVRAYSGVTSKWIRTKTDPSVRQAPAVDQARTFWKDLPFLSSQQSTIALASFCSLRRAPETKMALLLPVIAAIVFGSIMMSSDEMTLPDALRPFVPLSFFFLVMMGLSQQMFNQFGADRDGFRAYVMFPVQRRDILIGKNVSVAPLMTALCLVLVLMFQFFFPMGISHFLATLVQMLIAILIFSLLGNYTSIFFPYGVNRSTMKPVQLNVLTVLALMLAMFLSPVLFVPTFFFLGFESILKTVLGIDIQPFYLIASLMQLGIVIWIYRIVVSIQGKMLQKRETRILDLVANVAE